MLAGRAFDRTGIGHQLLNHAEIHQRLATEKIYLQILPGSGMRDQEIESLASDVVAH